MIPGKDSDVGRGIDTRQTSPTQVDPVQAGYAALLENIKERVRTSQVKAALSVNRELISLYWEIGKAIVAKQKAEGWGKSVVDRLANDLQAEFSGVSGFSPRNIWRMRAFYLAWTAGALAQSAREIGDVILPQLVAEMDGENLPQPVAEIPWGHNVWLIEKLDNPTDRLWYARKAIDHGWSRAVLVHQIESNLISRQGSAMTNFHATLPPSQSDLAHQLLKDPYTFDFLTIGNEAHERGHEQGLVEHIQQFLLELGVGFAFVGRQVHLEVGGDDFYIDLLFYHLRLRCYVVIDLKMEKFKPEFAGKMNFYLAVVDDLMRHGDDQPTIGLILCKEQNRIVAEYSLKDSGKPIGISQYILTGQLPERLKGSLPSVQQLEAEFSTNLDDKP